MTISGHPLEDQLKAFAVGTLSRGWHVAVATHVHSCPRCRLQVQMTEVIGGIMLENLPPAAMSDDAWCAVEARVGRVPGAAAGAASSVSERLADIPGLPAFVRRYPAGDWRWVAPSIRLLPLSVADTDGVRVFLLKAKPGLTLLPHTHTGMELTCVLTGNFSRDGARFDPGSFDFGDADVDHTIMIGGEAECICLVAMSGHLRFKGVVGRLVQRLISI